MSFPLTILVVQNRNFISLLGNMENVLEWRERVFFSMNRFFSLFYFLQIAMLPETNLF
jgi:hypothetical protein